MERVYGELRRLAAGYMRRERVGKTLQPTAVVNEAFMRLLPQRKVSWENRAHFFGIAAKMMRRVLVDHARRKKAIKRDAGPGEAVSVSNIPSPAREANPVDVLALNGALGARRARRAPGGNRRDAVLCRVDRRGNRGGPRDLAGHRQARMVDGEDVAQTRDARTLTEAQSLKLKAESKWKVESGQ
jgi:hypothetical protein